MAYKVVGIKGGEELIKKLKNMLSNANSTLNVGFFNSEEAYIASIQEFGAVINVPEHETTIYKSISEKTGNFNRKGRFVKKSKSNFATTHNVKSYTITIPSRPFMQKTVDTYKDKWNNQFARLLIKNKLDVKLTLEQMGNKVVGNMKSVIRKGGFIDNAPSTIKKKGFNKPLIDKGNLLRGIGYEIE